MAQQDDEWFDEAAGPLVRPYAMTGGRTRSVSIALDVATQVMVAHTESDLVGLGPEHLRILNLCQRPLSVAELAVYVDVPLGVVKVLLGDLIERGDIVVGSPLDTGDTPPDRDLLQAVLDGIRAL